MTAVAAHRKWKESVELAEVRKSLRMSQQEIAKILGMDRGTYKNYEYDTKPPTDLLARVRPLAGEIRRGLAPLSQAPMGKLTLYGSAGAGPTPGDTADTDEMWAPIEFCRPDYGGLTLNPNAVSMLPYLHPGDTLVFKDMPVTKLNKIMAVRLHDETLPIVKKIAFDGEKLVLRSFNPAYPDIAIDGVVPLGYLVGIISVDSDIRMGPEDAGIDEAYIDRKLRERLPQL